MGLNFTIDMTWGRLILLSLSKKRPKNQYPETKIAGKWWFSHCTLASAAFWKCVFWDTLYILRLSTFGNIWIWKAVCQSHPSWSQASSSPTPFNLIQACRPFGFCLNYLPIPNPSPTPNLDNLYSLFWTPKTLIYATFKITYYPKFFLNKGRILALWVMYTTKKQLKFQTIGIFEEIDSFYWPSCVKTFWANCKRSAGRSASFIVKRMHSDAFWARPVHLHCIGLLLIKIGSLEARSACAWGNEPCSHTPQLIHQ